MPAAKRVGEIHRIPGLHDIFGSKGKREDGPHQIYILRKTDRFIMTHFYFYSFYIGKGPKF